MAKKQISATVDEYVTHDLERLADDDMRSFSQMVEISMRQFRDSRLPEKERSSEEKGKVKSKGKK